MTALENRVKALKGKLGRRDVSSLRIEELTNAELLSIVLQKPHVRPEDVTDEQLEAVAAVTPTSKIAAI